ncbi:MAG: LytTR family DNA-binding domain-containing protein [bacterium]|nr:LytTR family DNA-binding domain-containing protein [bacterium]
MMNCVVIDDEPLAREGLKSYIDQIEYLNLVGEGSNPVELSNLLDKQKVDLIFLDIQMPILNGIDYLKMNKNLPIVIFTTAYPSYALDGYELDVLDYLLKPITFERFFQATNKAKDYHTLSRQSTDEATRTSDDFFFVKCSNKFEKIYYQNILYVEAMQNYSVIYTSEDKYMTLMSLKSVEDKLDSQRFLRVHKSYIVALDKVNSFENHELTILESKIPISRNYRKEVMDRVLGNKLW